MFRRIVFYDDDGDSASRDETFVRDKSGLQNGQPPHVLHWPNSLQPVKTTKPKIIEFFKFITLFIPKANKPLSRDGIDLIETCQAKIFFIR